MKRKDIKSTGFGSKLENEGKRLLNKDGSFNFEKTGVPLRTRFSLFHSLITISLWKFIIILLAFFIAINALFAIIYMMLGVEHLGLVEQSGSMQFLNAFFFSAQTITTVGYGAIAPTGVAPNIVASLEAFVGLLTFAMATGLLYGRFSRPRAKLLYSDKALIAPYLDGTALMFRLANARDSRMINASAKVNLSLIELENGEAKRKFYSLELEMNSINLLPASWTVVHPITADSPIVNMNAEDLKRMDIEVMIAFEGYDESYSQQVHSRTSYKCDEIVFGAKFEKILGRNHHGQATVALDRLSNYELVEL